MTAARPQLYAVKLRMGDPENQKEDYEGAWSASGNWPMAVS